MLPDFPDEQFLPIKGENFNLCGICVKSESLALEDAEGAENCRGVLEVEPLVQQLQAELLFNGDEFIPFAEREGSFEDSAHIQFYYNKFCHLN